MTIKVVGPPSPLGDEELRQWFEAHLKAHPHLGTASLSRQIGKSRAALDQYVAGKYFLPRENGGQGVDPKKSNIEKLIHQYRERVEGTDRHGIRSGFMETRTWMQVSKGIETAIAESAIVVIYGPPGVGKSRSLLNFQVENMVSSPLVVLCSRNVTVRYFVQRIAQQLGVDDRPSVPRLEDMVAEKLKRSPRPLFVDQANYLREESLGTCCHLWEVARIPIVLFGTRDLYDLFMNTKMTQDVRAQLSSRVKMHYELSGLTIEELKGIVTRSLPAGAATDDVVAEVQKQSLGIHRHVEFMLERMNQIGASNAQRLRAGETSWREVAVKAAGRLMTL